MDKIKKKKIFIGLTILIIICVAAFIRFGNKDNKPGFRTEKVTQGEVISAISAAGAVNPVTIVLVGTQVSGTIKKIYVDYNSVVKKGQLIAQIDPAIVEAQVRQAKANLLSAQANLDKAEATLVNAKRTFDRNKELFSKKLVARSDLDTAETKYETDRAQVGASKAQEAQAKAALEFAQTNLTYRGYFPQST